MERPKPLRGILILAVLVALVLVWAGVGIYVARQQRIFAPNEKAVVVAEEVSAEGGASSLERFFLGLYLGLRRGEIEAPAGSSSTPVPFSIQPGETAATIAPRLERVGLVRSAELFRYLARSEGVDRNLEAGDYSLRPDMNMRQVLAELLEGHERGLRVTIPEGWRAEQIAELLENRGVALAEEFMALVRTDGLEGYLFPDTYEFAAGEGAKVALGRMTANFDRRFPKELREKTQSQGLSLPQVVILASIVQREMALAEEAPLIAGVYLNRLRQDMKLDADPTVQYALGLRNGRRAWWEALKPEDLAYDSPYNTYRVKGLPPGPICNPGLVALQAVIEPKASAYLYFVRNDQKGDGSHVFARTFEEHLANIAKYQKR